MMHPLRRPPRLPPRKRRRKSFGSPLAASTTLTCAQGIAQPRPSFRHLSDPPHHGGRTGTRAPARDDHARYPEVRREVKVQRLPRDRPNGLVQHTSEQLRLLHRRGEVRTRTSSASIVHSSSHRAGVLALATCARPRAQRACETRPSAPLRPRRVVTVRLPRSLTVKRPL